MESLCKRVKIISIIMIVFSVLGIIGSVLTVLGIGALTLLTQNGFIYVILVITSVLVIASSVIQLVTGIKGLKASSEPSLVPNAFKWGVVVIVIAAVTVILSMVGSEFSIGTLITGLVIPVVYVILVGQLKNAVIGK